MVFVTTVSCRGNDCLGAWLTSRLAKVLPRAPLLASQFGRVTVLVCSAQDVAQTSECCFQRQHCHRASYSYQRPQSESSGGDQGAKRESRVIWGGSGSPEGGEVGAVAGDPDPRFYELRVFKKYDSCTDGGVDLLSF